MSIVRCVAICRLRTSCFAASKAQQRTCWHAARAVPNVSHQHLRPQAAHKRILVHGFPCTMAQLEAFESLLAAARLSVITFDVDEPAPLGPDGLEWPSLLRNERPKLPGHADSGCVSHQRAETSCKCALRMTCPSYGESIRMVLLASIGSASGVIPMAILQKIPCEIPNVYFRPACTRLGTHATLPHTHLYANVEPARYGDSELLRTLYARGDVLNYNSDELNAEQLAAQLREALGGLTSAQLAGAPGGHAQATVSPL